MLKRGLALLTAVIAVSGFAGIISYEAEQLLCNVKVSAERRIPQKKWCVWVGDTDAYKKWSAGGVLSAAGLQRESAPDKSELPILHFKVPIKTDGIYEVKAGFGMRPVAYALSKKGPWHRGVSWTKVIRKRKCSAGTELEFFVSHAYIPEKISRGAVYIDRIIVEKLNNVGFKNGDFSQKPVGKEVLPGWTFSATEPEKVKLLPDSSKKTLTVKSDTRMGWFIENRGREIADPGDQIRFSGVIRNSGKKRVRAMLTIYEFGMSGHRTRTMGYAWIDLQPGQSRQVAVSGVAGRLADFCSLRISGYGQGQMVFSSFKAEALGRADNADIGKIIGKSVKYDPVERLFSISGKSWHAESEKLYQGMPGENLCLSFSYRYLSDCSGKVRLDVPGFVALTPGCNSLVSQELPRVVAGEWSQMTVYIPMPPMLNAVKLRLSGDCAVQLRDIKIKKSDFFPVQVSHHAKVPDFGVAVREREKLGRGVSAAVLPGNGLYVSWRILPQDKSDTGFDVYGSVDGKKFIRLNKTPVVQTSDFTTYRKEKFKVVEVRRVGKGKERSRAGVLPRRKGIYPYQEYRFPLPPLRVGVGDLDGDGEYDLVACCGRINIDPWHVCWQPSGGTYKLVAMHRSGKKLWEFDMSPNIECGIWYAPFMVQDLDGDGKAEVVLKGNLPGDGDWREKSGVNFGKVISGPERLLVLDGMTGKVKAHAPWPSRQEFYAKGGGGVTASFRNMLACAWLNGKTPAIVALRGTYGLQLAEAWSFRDGKLEKLWNYNSREYPAKYRGQGAHTTRVADLDGDGRDEIILGGAVLDDDGRPLWSTGRGHPDHLFVGDLMPQNPGFEVLTIYESRAKAGGFTCADGKTGKVLWQLDSPSRHIHRGYAGDIDARFRGVDCGGADSLSGGHYGNMKYRHYTPCGKLLHEDGAAPMAKIRGFTTYYAFWDADLQREFAGRNMMDYRGGASGFARIEGSLVMQADIAGDWREEIICRLGNNLRVYRTTIPAMDRRLCLMYDHCYRMGITATSSGYRYDVMPSKLFTSEAPNLNLTAVADSEYLEIVISAPLKQALKGRLKLFPDRGLFLSSREFEVELSPGKSVLEKVKFMLRRSGTYRVRAELDCGNGKVLKGMVPIIR